MLREDWNYIYGYGMFRTGYGLTPTPGFIRCTALDRGRENTMTELACNMALGSLIPDYSHAWALGSSKISPSCSRALMHLRGSLVGRKRPIVQIVLVRSGVSDNHHVEKDRKLEVEKNVVLTMLDAELQRGNERQALTLARGLRGFGAASLVPQRLYTLQDLRLHNIDAKKFLSPVDSTLDSVRTTLLLALGVGGVVLWQALKLEQAQLLYIVVTFIFLGTLDQVFNGGGIEGLLIDSLGRILSSKYGLRVAQHEAGHFLVSYLMGILPKSYTLSSFDALLKEGSLNVQAGTTFVDFEFQDEVMSGTLSSEMLNKFSCVALAGVATEYILYGVAEGGLSDIQQLDALLKGLNFSQGKADSQVRWAVLNTVTLLRRHQSMHAKLVQAMSSGRSISQCIGVIEDEIAIAKVI